MSKTWKTFASFQGDEVDVLIEYFKQPKEEDTGTPAGIEIEGILLKSGEDIMPKMSEEEIEQVLLSVIAMESDHGDY